MDLRFNEDRDGYPRVLLVDDNADLREYVRRLLAEHFEVEVADDGGAALEAARDHRPDIVVSDVLMPVLDGYGLIRELRADPELCDVPVILISGRADDDARAEGARRGADAYLAKPFSAEDLLAQVKALLRSPGARRGAALRPREVVWR
jgi:DNA-binding response OmpR family regulator